MINYKRTVYLKKASQEHYNLKRAWLVNAWRLVDKNARDAVQPWFDTKRQARNFCKLQGWNLVEETLV